MLRFTRSLLSCMSRLSLTALASKLEFQIKMGRPLAAGSAKCLQQRCLISLGFRALLYRCLSYHGSMHHRALEIWVRQTLTRFSQCPSHPASSPLRSCHPSLPWRPSSSSTSPQPGSSQLPEQTASLMTATLFPKHWRT